jgi:CRP-like cAMP-binding protein
MSCHHNQSCASKVPIFKSLTDSEMDQLHQVIQKREYKKGTFIFQEGESSEALFIVNKGLIKISKVSDEGREQIIRILFPGDFLGQFSLLQNKKHYANAEVIEATEVCLILKNDFKDLMETNPEMTYRFLIAISERLQQADEWMGDISLLEVERRLAKMLLLFHQKHNYSNDKSFELPVSKKDFAALIGTTPETLSRKLVSLESNDILRMNGRKGITIVNYDGLSELAGVYS